MSCFVHILLKQTSSWYPQFMLLRSYWDVFWDTSATPTSGSVTYAFTADGNPGSIASGTITAGAVTLAGTLNYEAAQSYTFKVV